VTELAQAPAGPAAGWREPPAPRAVLRAAAVAGAGAVAAARLHDLSRSHSLTFAELPDGTTFVVKRIAPGAHAAGRSLAAELYAYRLASWRPGLAAALPRALHLDERRQVIVLAAAAPEHLFPARCADPGFPGPALCAALGDALAAVHRATTGVPLPAAASCGIVRLPAAPPGQRGLAGDSAAAAGVAEAVVADAVLAPALRRTAAALVPSCLVHADVKWDNAVLDPGPPARVALFDWELSGLGDPAWDVGSALADTVTLALRTGGLAALAPAPGDWLAPDLRALLRAYGAGADGRDGLAARIAGCWTARTVHLALECAAALDDAGHRVVREMLAAARLLADAHGTITEAVDDALGGAS
jgi:aminoglycoside phosphotransferase (APT) family kinase protein